jgi:O-Antigen ligase
LFDPWMKALTTSDPVSPFAWFLLMSIAYGIFEVVRGILLGFPPLTAIQNLVFNIYPIYFFLGLWVGKRRPELVLKFYQVFAICFTIYAPAYLLVLNKIYITMPGSEGVSIFGQAGGGGMIVLALLALDPKPSRFWLPMTMGGIQLLAGQVRAEWLGIGIAFFLWGMLSKKMSRVAGFFFSIVLLLAIGYVLDINIPSSSERGGAISTQEIVARGLSAISPELAQDVTGSTNTAFYNGTITWRENWWHAIWQNSQENYTNLLIGPGYGFMLKSLVGYLKTFGDLRTPHNIFYYALGYTGWIGVTLFFAIQGACGVLVWRAYRITGQAFGVAFWASALFTSFFGNAFETPFGAIPAYLIIGIIVGPTLGRTRSTEQLEHHYAGDQSYESELAYTTE